MKRTTTLAIVAALCLVLGATPGPAQVTTEVTINGNQATASVSTPLYGLDVTLTFEQAVGLSTQTLGLSAAVVNPLDTELLARLPTGVSVPAALPLLVAIEPPTSGGLSFAGVATLEIHTHDLEFLAGCPFRIFASHGGGPFEDVTDFMGMGSYRGRSRTGGFSDFLILADTRAPGTVVDAKLDRLWGLLEDASDVIDYDVYSDLYQTLAAAEAAWGGGDTQTARDAMDTFASAVLAASGSDIPDVWRSARDLSNVAGELRSAAATLRFSLSLAS